MFRNMFFLFFVIFSAPAAAKDHVALLQSSAAAVGAPCVGDGCHKKYSQSVEALLQSARAEAAVDFSQLESDEYDAEVVRAAISRLLSGRRHRKLAMNGRPDTSKATRVAFGVFMKKFFGVQEKDGSWMADVIVTSAWNDTRVMDLLGGQNNITLPIEEAQGQLWTPNVQVTNVCFKAPLVISSAVIVTDQFGGYVQQITRVQVTVTSTYDLENMPFDTQILGIKVASVSYMANELVMVPDYTGSGVRNRAVEEQGEWVYTNFTLDTIVEETGPLSKSRGIYSVEVKRDFKILVNSTVIPEILLVILAWTVFFLPNSVAYAMPKVASCMIPLLAFLTYKSQLSQKLPPNSGGSWLEVFEECCTFLLCYAVFINVIVLKLAHVLKKADLAEDYRLWNRTVYLCVVVVSFTTLIAQRHAKDMQVVLAYQRLFFAILVLWSLARKTYIYSKAEGEDEKNGPAEDEHDHT